jgi:hypothetical protein
MALNRHKKTLIKKVGNLVKQGLKKDAIALQLGITPNQAEHISYYHFRDLKLKAGKQPLVKQPLVDTRSPQARAWDKRRANKVAKQDTTTTKHRIIEINGLEIVIANKLINRISINDSNVIRID